MRASSRRYVPLVIRVWRLILRDTTARGRFVLAAAAICAILGADTRRSQVYALFALAAGSLAVAAAWAFARRPLVTLAYDFPTRATAGVPLKTRLNVSGNRSSGPLLIDFPITAFREAQIKINPENERIAVDLTRAGSAFFEWQPSQRGRYELPGPRARRSDPFGLFAGREVRSPGGVVYVYPRYFHVEEFDAPLGRKLQPGGVPLSSSTGDAVEFVGTREYRPGDPLRTIHWRSWARTGAPVVKEFQEEYFSRLALVLDTFVPPRFAQQRRQPFEAAVSLLASLADYFSRSEAIVDIFAAGPDLYEVSAGRSLAYLDNILDVLACLDMCPDPPFATLGPSLAEKLRQTTSVVAVLLDWDAARSRFMTRARDMGVATRTLIVRAEATSIDWRPAAEEMAIEIVTPEAVMQRLAHD